MDAAELVALQDQLGYYFQDLALLQQALNHPSCGGAYFERLEFLGDRVIGLAIADLLYHHYPHDPEGALAKRQAYLVSRPCLYIIAQQLKLASVVSFASQRHPQYQITILADTVEALMAAIYLDGGWPVVQPIIQHLWKPQLQGVTEPPPIDAKSALQEYLQAQGEKLPTYETMAQTGPSHEPCFRIRLQVKNGLIFYGEGRTKREAAQAAAQTALKALEASKD